MSKDHKTPDESQLKNILLGQTTDYIDLYDASILYPVPRKINRDALGLDSNKPMPFVGEDVWHGYELSWLNAKGKPVVALAKFVFGYNSTNIVESKSFKLYLNSFNQTRFDSTEQVRSILEKDLANTANGQVDVQLFTPQQLTYFTPTVLPGDCIDDCDINIDDYHFNAGYLKQRFDANNLVDETLHSHLLKSNCLITNQPDWASVVISYSGGKIDRESLLRYLISFRQHNEFHEQCVERIFNDIHRLLAPTKLAVTACYTRRGGLDINPSRTSELANKMTSRINRQ
jgi:7-cyano-7-deazaguanine reductase